MKIIRFLILAILFCLIFNIKIFSQSSAIPWSSFNNGFAITTSGNDNLKSVVGQTFVGSMQQGNTHIESGFLAALISNQFSDVNSESNNQLNALNYQLFQNYPNPFNPSTTIQFTIPKPVLVNLKIIDVLGREIVTLINENLTAGKHEVVFNTANLASGVYFYRLETADFSATEKLMLVK